MDKLLILIIVGVGFYLLTRNYKSSDYQNIIEVIYFFHIVNLSFGINSDHILSKL